MFSPGLWVVFHCFKGDICSKSPIDVVVHYFLFCCLSTCKVKQPRQVAWGNSGRLKQQGNHTMRSKLHGVHWSGFPQQASVGVHLFWISHLLSFFSPHSVSPSSILLLLVTNGSMVSCFTKHGHKEAIKKKKKNPESEIGEAPRWSSHQVLPFLLGKYRLALPGHPMFPFTEKEHHKRRPVSLYLLRSTENFL